MLANEPVPTIGPRKAWQGRTLRLPEDLDGLDLALPGPHHAVRAQFDALCVAKGVIPRLRAEVDDMAMLRLVARDSRWLTMLPEIVVQDELRAGVLGTVGRSGRLQESFYAITTLHRHRIERLDQLLARRPSRQPKPATVAGQAGPT